MRGAYGWGLVLLGLLFPCSARANAPATRPAMQFVTRSDRQLLADYIRSIDKNHLIMDGKNIGDGFDYYPWGKLGNVDIESPHYHTELVGPALKIFAQQKKVTIIGEFKWNGNVDLMKYLTDIENDSRVAGDLYWDLMPHADDHGFVQHEDGLTLHYPGDTADMRQRAALLRSHAYAMRGQAEPPAAVCGAPLLSGITAKGNGYLVAWRGTAGADHYELERSTAGHDGPWDAVATGAPLTDNDTPWLDRIASAKAVWYRVRAVNLAGVAGPYSATMSAGQREKE